MAYEGCVRWALQDGRPVHVTRVPRGTACGCFCASCGEPVIARQGGSMSWHFAHASGSECAGAYETSLHVAGKATLEKLGRIRLPAVMAEFPMSRREPVVVVPAMDEDIVSVVFEERRGNVIPDVIITTAAGYEIFVEIAVTHYVDEVKLAKLKAMGTPVLEVDIGDVRDGEPDFDAIFLGDSERKRWMFHPSEGAAYGAFLRASESRTAVRGFVLDCPVGHGGAAGANLSRDCGRCIYCIERHPRRVLCTGASRAGSMESLGRAFRYDGGGAACP